MCSLASVRFYFDDDGFDSQLQRSIGKADSGMANVGECLAIAEQITPGDRDSWYQSWAAFASRLKEQADAAVQAGHMVSARGAYLRAAEYFRQAFFFHRDDLDGTQLRAAYPASVVAFRPSVGRFGTNRPTDGRAQWSEARKRAHRGIKRVILVKRS